MEPSILTRATGQGDSGRPIVVTGAGGFVGRHLLASTSVDNPLFVVTRRGVPDLPAHATEVRGDLADRAFLVRAMPRGSAVVNLVYDRLGSTESNLALARALAEACGDAGVERLVHVSTASVAGLCEAADVTEATEPRPVTAYQRAKLDIEAAVTRIASGRFPIVILRPTAVFGPGGANLVKLTRALLRGSRWMNYLHSSLSSRRSMNLVPVETVVAAIEFALRSPRAVNDRLYFVSDDDAAENTFRGVERVLQQGLGVKDYPVPPLPMPISCLTTALRLAGRLEHYPSVRFSNARLSHAGFSAPVSFRQALERYAEQARVTALADPMGADRA